MPSPASMPLGPWVDLTSGPPLERHVRALERVSVDRAWTQAVDVVAADPRGAERARRVGEILRKHDTKDAVELLKAAGRSSLALDSRGIRALFAVLEVKRPGVEVLRQLEVLSSLERVALHVVRGRWGDAGAGGGENPVFPILEVLEEGLRVGVLDVGVERLPRRPQALQALFSHVRAWFLAARTRLELGKRLPEDEIHYLTQLGMIEIHLLEARLSRLASRIDPEDTARMARLLPVLSRYDQDMDHMKDVVSRLSTYEPFHERMLTVEHAVTSDEWVRIEQMLRSSEAGAGLARILGALRESPILDRRLAMLTSALHQVGLWAAAAGGPKLPDLHSTVLRVVEADAGEMPLQLHLPPPLADAIWPRAEERGFLSLGPGALEIPFREDRIADYLEDDGAPRLPLRPDDKAPAALSMKDLVRSQLRNDPIILGMLENAKVTSLPGVMELLASQSRSLRVLDKICRTPSLYTGPANKNVPVRLLANPSRIPMTHLRRFVNVRFVSKVDLRHLARNAAGLRPEVVKEVQNYLATLKG